MFTFREYHTVNDYLSSNKLLFDDIREAFLEYGEGNKFKRISYDDVIEAIRQSDLADSFDFEKYDTSKKAGFSPELFSKPIRWAGQTVDYFDGVIRLHDFGQDYTCRSKPHLITILQKQYDYTNIPQLLKVLSEMMPIILQMSERYKEQEKTNHNGTEHLD